MSFMQGTRGRRIRRGYPISAFVGPNGSGKSACLVWDTLPSLDAGRPVLSTVRLLDWRNPRLCDDDSCVSPDHARHMAAHPLYVPLTTWQQILDAEHCDVLMDEVTGIASARESHGLPGPVANLLVQLRRRDVMLRWSSPSWARADKIIRETTQLATLCQGFFPVKADDDDGTERMWRHRRMFVWRSYDAALLDDFEAARTGVGRDPRDRRVKPLRPVVRDRFWGPGSEVFSAYDTMDSITTIGTVSDSGRCLRCDGRRRARACSCDDVDHGGESSPGEGAGPRRSRGARSSGEAPRRAHAATMDDDDTPVTVAAPALTLP